MKVVDLQEQVDRGEYQVDTQAVAAAILRRILGERGQGSTAHGSSSA
jgi:anti-sigma28 factor (negative regulator of flagellin synthesis)